MAEEKKLSLQERLKLSSERSARDMKALEQQRIEHAKMMEEHRKDMEESAEHVKAMEGIWKETEQGLAKAAADAITQAMEIEKKDKGK